MLLSALEKEIFYHYIMLIYSRAFKTTPLAKTLSAQSIISQKKKLYPNNMCQQLIYRQERLDKFRETLKAAGGELEICHTWPRL